jgi:tetratricopeptide (TPR) repeat protein
MLFKTPTRLSALAMAGMFAAAPGALAAQGTQGKTGPQADKPAAAAQTDPANPLDRRRAAYESYIQGEAHARAGEYVPAIEAFKKATELDPTADEPRVALARLYLSNRDIDAARAAAQEAIQANKQSVDAHAVLVEIYLNEAIGGGGLSKDKAQSAITELEWIVKADEKADVLLNNHSVKALGLLGMLYKAVDDDKKALDAYERLSRIDSTSSDTATSLAEIYFDQRRYRDAARAADQAHKIDPTNPKASLILAQSLMRTGRAAEAVDVYKQLIDNANDQAKLALAKDYADALVQAGKYNEAIETVKPVLAKNSKDIGAVRVLADAQRRSGRRDLAIKTLQDALVGQDVSESIELVFALAETYEETEQFDKAISTYEDALSALINPDGTVGADDKKNVSVILRRIASAERAAGHKEKVAETYERMRKVLGADDATPDMLEVQDKIETADYDGAVLQARKAIGTAKGDDKRTLTFLEAQALGRKGSLGDAVKLLQSLIGAGGEDSDVYAFMAVVQLDAGDAPGAEHSIRKALEPDPNDTSLLITLSSIQDKAGQYKESEATLRRVLELDPDNSTALNNLGYFLTERKERLDEALQLIQRAVNIDPTNGSFLDSLGWLYFQMGKLPEAKRYLEQAVTYEHQSSTIREHLGDLYAKIGDTARARQYWEAALRLSNERDEVARLKGKLQE